MEDNEAWDDDDDRIDDTYLLFQLAGESYGIGVQSVSEISRIEDATPVPDVPDYILGVVNLRGQVVPILDLRRRFKVTGCPDAPRPVNVVMEHENALVAITVDKVTGIRLIEPDSIRLPLGHSTLAEAQSMVLGLYAEDQDVHILLDPEKVLSATQAAKRAAKAGS